MHKIYLQDTLECLNATICRMASFFRLILCAIVVCGCKISTEISCSYLLNELITYKINDVQLFLIRYLILFCSLIYALRMSVFFFRLHNLRREEEKKQRRKKQGSGQLTRDPSPLTLAPSRLFEKSPVTPSDSLDEIALQIPRLFLFSFQLCLISFSWIIY